jgi:hypothetical protein
MTANKTGGRINHAASHTVHLRPGEGLWEARCRWEGSTGRRGLVLIR